MRHSAWVVVATGVIAALAGAAPAWAQAQPPPPAQAGAGTAPVSRIAFVDVNRVLARSAAGAQARESLERERAAMQKEFDGKADEIKRLSEELEKKGPLMTPEVRREKQEVFDRKRRDVARLADDLARELEKKEGLLLQKVVQDIRGLVDKLGKERGYFMIVERQRAGVLYGAAEADLTDEVIRLYDAGNKPKK